MRHLLLLLPPLAILFSCSDPAVPPPLPPTMTVGPIGRTISTGDTLQFFASVANRLNPSLSWSVLPQDGSTYGTISASGLYRAPSAIPGTSIDVRIVATLSPDYQRDTVTVRIIPRPRGTLVVPGIGSTYVFDKYKFDTNGRKVPGSDTVVAYTALGYCRHDGRDSVLAFGSWQDTVRFQMIATGDVAWNVNAIDGNWLNFAFATRTKDSVMLEDTLRAGGVRFSLSASATWLGQAEIALQGDKYVTQRVCYRHIERRTGPQWYVIGWENTYEFVPSIGFYRQVTHVAFYQDAVDNWTFGDKQELRSFVLR